MKTLNLAMLLFFSLSSEAFAIPAEGFIKMRCNLSPAVEISKSEGKIYAMTPFATIHVLDFVGMNATRCLKVRTGGVETWYMTSREMFLYKDPVGGHVIHEWHNPLTNEAVPVMHVANKLVQFPLGRDHIASQEIGDQIMVSFDMNLLYPNPLKDGIYTPYSPQENYVASEYFKFFAKKSSIVAPRASIPYFATWNRFGPFLPWMKMGDLQGYLNYSAVAEKVSGVEDLDPALQETLQGPLSYYLEPPKCLVKGLNENSWTYFKDFFQEYLDGEKFPLAVPKPEEECQAGI